MRNSFTFGAYNSKDCGLLISKRPSPVIPERRKTVQRVAGRPDDLYEDEGTYNNIPLPYTVGCKKIDENLDNIKRLINQPGYQKLYDTYRTDGFYRAFVNNAVSFTEKLLNFGEAVIEFSADPWFYLNSGTNSISVSSGTTLTDPTGCGSKPVIMVNGSGGSQVAIFINSKQYNVKIPSGYSRITLDCFNETAYTTAGDAIKYYISDDFPEFDGTNPTISFTGASSLRIIPNWRK